MLIVDVTLAQKSASCIVNKALLTLIEKDHMTVTHCLLFMLQPIYLHNVSLHMSSQPITSSFYKWPLYLLTNQIAHQGF